MKNTTSLLISIFFVPVFILAQSSATSPYAIFGIGNKYQSDMGSITGMGGSGLAIPTSEFINNTNPASLGFMRANHFLFDIGGKMTQSEFQDKERSESRNNIQFSHIGFAFPVNAKSGVSFILKPYTSSAYKISLLELPIMNSVEKYYLSALGSGGLNNFDLSYGYRITDKLSLGLSASFLFGNTNDTRSFLVGTSITTIDKDIHYNGFRPSLGVQYESDKIFNLGAVVRFPTQINASKVQSSSTYENEYTTSFESDVASSYDDFNLPLEIGVGISSKFKNNLTLNFDYEYSLWSKTDQSSIYGDFVNSSRFALGFSYKKPKERLSYFDKVRYTGGLNYDTGSLLVNSKKIEDKYFSIGLSLPIDNGASALNISYSLGQRAKISSGLIKENYHKLSVNLSLDGLWFVKRKIF